MNVRGLGRCQIRSDLTVKMTDFSQVDRSCTSPLSVKWDRIGLGIREKVLGDSFRGFGADWIAVTTAGLKIYDSSKICRSKTKQGRRMVVLPL